MRLSKTAKAATKSPNISNKAREKQLLKSNKWTITEKERQHLIQEAAYYRAEHRGFLGGNPEQDWFEAESDINKLLEAPRSH